MAAPRRPVVASAEAPARLPYAALSLRIVSFILDVLVLISAGVVFFLGSWVLFILLRTDFLDRDPTQGEFNVLVGIFLGYLVFVPVYHVLFWALWGQTVGMIAVHIKVTTRGGARLSLARAALRLIAFVASTLPLFLGLAVALFDRERRTLHDILAGTVVIELP